MIMRPEIGTDVSGLVLRALTPDDAAAYYALVDRNREHLSCHGDYQAERDATPAWVRDHLGEDPGPDHRLGIRLDGELIGRVDLVAVDPPSYGTGYWLDVDHTGKGLATAACRALYGYAADSLGVTDVYAGVTHGNEASVTLLRRLGFVPVADFERYTRFHLSLQSR